jgi:Glutamyl-tRNAGlu reductase, dimerisation domain
VIKNLVPLAAGLAVGAGLRTPRPWSQPPSPPRTSGTGAQQRCAPQRAIRTALANAEAARQQMLARHAQHLAGLTGRQRAAVDAVTQALVDQLVGGPLRRARQLAGGPGDPDGAAALGRLLCELYPPDAPAGDAAPR